MFLLAIGIENLVRAVTCYIGVRAELYVHLIGLSHVVGFWEQTANVHKKDGECFNTLTIIHPH